MSPPLIAWIVSCVSLFFSFVTLCNTFWRQRASDLSKWIDEAINVLSEAVHLDEVTVAESQAVERRNTRHKLSSLIDRGKALPFFPNANRDKHGTHKPEVYKGHRMQILDWLVFAYKLCYLIPAQDRQAVRALLIDMQRGFTSDARAARSWPLSSWQFRNTKKDHPKIKDAEAFIKRCGRH